jgi:hypothetical protein
MSSPRLFKQFFSIGGSDITTSVVAGGSGFFTLPAAGGNITVSSTAGFFAASVGNPQIINVVSFNNTSQYINNTITYTGISGNTFTGCSGGSGTVFNGYPVTQLSNAPVLDTFWTAPPGVKWVIVTGCGGGGGGGSGGSISSTNSAYPLFVWVIAGGGAVDSAL